MNRLVMMSCSVCVYLLPVRSISQVASPQKITVRQVICPKVCLGENKYKIAFTLPAGATVLPESGTVSGDSIVNISSSANNSVRLRITFANTSTADTTLNLPVCDPFIPTQPLVTSETICAGSAVPALVAIAESAAVVDWYDAPTGGNRLAVATAEFIPNGVGSYYAQSRVEASGCVSQSRGKGSVLLSEGSKKCIEITAARSAKRR